MVVGPALLVAALVVTGGCSTRHICHSDGDCGDLGACALPDSLGNRFCSGTLHVDGTPCESAEQCVGGHCILDGKSGVCASKCTNDTCNADFTCLPEERGEPICMPLTDHREAGAACDNARECTSGHCVHFKSADVDLGTLCAAPCPADGTCDTDHVCWDVSNTLHVCGPTPPPP